MRARTLFLTLTMVAAFIPMAANAAVPEPFIYQSRLIGMPSIYPNAPYGTIQTAVRAGNAPTLQVYVHSQVGPSAPALTADLSALGFSAAATTTGAWAGYGALYYPAYYYDFGPLTIGASISDGAKDIPLVATDVNGNVATATARIIVDNAPPTVALTNITFSTTSPRNGDTMYFSGHASGTGTRAAVSYVREELLDASGTLMRNTAAPRFPATVDYDQHTVNMALSNSLDGSFVEVPVTLWEANGEVPLAPAAFFRLRVGVYDEAGNIASTTITVPINAPLAPPDPCASTTCASNVLFLPGIEASRLYRPDGGGGDKKLWEPSLLDTLHDLYLTPEGKSVRTDVYTKAGDIIDETPVTGANIYKSFIAKMNGLVAAGTINAWEADPYDWRLSLDDILAHGKQVGTHISYLDATSTPYIIQELKRLAATSKTHKVTIVAHSNGGLVAKQLTELLGPDASTLIDKMIFVAVPQAGTPAAVAADLHGYGQAFGGGFAVSQATARTFASTSPMAYHLLPSARYFTQVDNPAVSFDSSLPDWIARYGATIHSQARLHTFLIDSYGRVASQTGDINQPIQLSGTLLSSAEAVHSDLDNWAPPAGVQLIQIAGWGVPTTVASLTYKKKDAGVSPEANFTVDGDGTVVVPSALWTSTTTGVANYWVDLKSYNTLLNRILGLRLKADHSSILEVPSLLAFITDNLLVRDSSILPQYISSSTPPTDSHDIRLRYALHSPLTLNLYDDQGRHTGVSTTTGQVEEQIPGTYYTEFGDVKYLFTDASTSAQVVMEGYAPGTFTFNVDQYSGDVLTASTTFKDIPTTASTTATLSIQSDITTLSPMKIDKNGDGIIDATLAPKLGGVVTLDTTPPEIQLTFSTSTRALAFIATDDSGTATIATSTVYPALKKNQKAYSGIATTTVTARDASSNTTALVYTEQLPSPAQRDTIMLQALVYNGATTTLSSAAVSYKWRINKDGLFSVFASRLNTASTTLESHYRPKKDKTIIMTKPQDLDDTDTDDNADTRPTKQTLPGMVVPYMMTGKGNLIINY